MTREEAIVVLENEIKCVDKDCNIERSCGNCPYAMPSKEPILEAYRLAIETLEQEPCEDCISRQAVIKVLNKMDRYVADELTLCDTERKFPKNEVFIVDDVYENTVEQLPPVIPAEKVGHWIKHDTGHSIYYDCSRCSCLAPCTETADKILWKMANYCPDCGAKMQKVEE